jgi:cytochrome bd-type quinol oxidase subunit 1
MKGLDSVPNADKPPVGIVFWGFRVMVGIGFAMLGLGIWSLVARHNSLRCPMGHRDPYPADERSAECDYAGC